MTDIVLPPDPEPDEAIWYVGKDFFVRAIVPDMTVETIPAVDSYTELNEQQQIAVRAAHMWLRRRIGVG